MTLDDLLAKLEQAVRHCGSAKALAAEWQISEQHLCDMRKGRRHPGPLVLKAMHLEQVVTYRKLTTPTPPRRTA